MCSPDDDAPDEGSDVPAPEQPLGRAERRAVERVMMSVSSWSAVATRMAVFTAFLYLLLRIAAPYISVGGGPAGSAISVIVFMLLSIALVYYITRIPLSPQAEGAGALVAAAFWVTFAYVLSGDFGIPKGYADSLVVPRLAGAHVAMILVEVRATCEVLMFLPAISRLDRSAL